MELDKLKKLFRVDNPGQHAHIDLAIPMWQDGEPDWENHFNGKNSLCVTPIGRDNTCYWGALDIDSKGDSKPVHHESLQEFCTEHKIPLNIFRSKSGKGAHAYLFSPDPVPAQEIRAILYMYSLLLKPLLDKSNGIEIFPKQDELIGDDNGSCIRPPYFGDKCQPVFEGDPVVKSIISIPPCLSAIPEEGDRNNFVYHSTNFLMLSGMQNVKVLVQRIGDNMDDPLPTSEIEKTVASAQRQRSRKGTGFGLGCTYCPDSRKKSCQFSSQLKIKQTTDIMQVQIVHYLAEDPKIRLTVEGKSLTFDTEEAFNNHSVRVKFITNHRTPAIPLMKKGEWGLMLHSLLDDADHIDEVTHRDKGHFIVQKLKAWSKNFKPGISGMYSGVPCFISDSEVLVFPHDVYNWFVQTGVVGITREDIIATLESLGEPTVMQGSPAIKIPVDILDTKSPGLEIPIISDIDPGQVVVEAGSDGTAIFKTKEGVQISLTNSYIQEHPEIKRQMIEVTKTNININF